MDHRLIASTGNARNVETTMMLAGELVIRTQLLRHDIGRGRRRAGQKDQSDPGFHRR